MKKKWIWLLGIMLVVVAGCASSTAEEIEINDDKIPSVYKVLGEKKITGTNSSIKDDVRTTELTYKAGSISEEELVEYMTYLIEEEGFIPTIDTKEEDGKLTNQLGAESVTDEHIVLIDLTCSTDFEGSTVITYRSGPGQITKNNE
ncbi:hypothetical protein I6N96_16715 [Enterococcus sp. BWM-S5]|uniref:DUF1307 domain-containing protein n=1 Tax=Enterococcus larvae TaxID=2794352 RepID=A0ABS4CQ78_9ENTE|nr:hypothetical protein [Enterococcus larvae]MBP1047934.1 hypothetical protein [Enterococcus larvae]